LQLHPDNNSVRIHFCPYGFGTESILYGPASYGPVRGPFRTDQPRTGPYGVHPVRAPVRGPVRARTESIPYGIGTGPRSRGNKKKKKGRHGTRTHDLCHPNQDEYRYGPYHDGYCDSEKMPNIYHWTLTKKNQKRKTWPLVIPWWSCWVICIPWWHMYVNRGHQ
jgi:hypothetical protein